VTASMARRSRLHIGSAKAEIERLAAAEGDVELLYDGGQPYVRAGGIEAPSPPWDRTKYDILVAIPIAYELGTGLDGFYIALPYSFNSSEHNRVNGNVVTVANRQWKAVSWHYPDGKLFRNGVDTIENHIVHCRGFFLARGVVNGRF
jgi:hypothetical protein